MERWEHGSLAFALMQTQSVAFACVSCFAAASAFTFASLRSMNQLPKAMPTSSTFSVGTDNDHEQISAMCESKVVGTYR